MGQSGSQAVGGSAAIAKLQLPSSLGSLAVAALWLGLVSYAPANPSTNPSRPVRYNTIPAESLF